MILNLSLDTNDFRTLDEYGYTKSFEEVIIDKIIENLTNQISSSKYWQDTYVIGRILDNVLLEGSTNIKKSFEDKIEDKIKRSNVSAKINSKIKELSKDTIIKEVKNLINFEDIIKKEVNKIMNEKFK